MRDFDLTFFLGALDDPFFCSAYVFFPFNDLVLRSGVGMRMRVRILSRAEEEIIDTPKESPVSCHFFLRTGERYHAGG